jgi:hypothetical protein
MFSEQKEIFLLCPRAVVDSRREVIEPAFLALSLIAPWHVVCDCYPIILSKCINQIAELLVFCDCELGM